MKQSSKMKLLSFAVSLLGLVCTELLADTFKSKAEETELNEKIDARLEKKLSESEGS